MAKGKDLLKQATLCQTSITVKQVPLSSWKRGVRGEVSPVAEPPLPALLLVRASSLRRFGLRHERWHALVTD
jgi:hypothetical protein